MVVNNLINNPGSAAIHYGLQRGEWGTHPWVTGQIAIVGNVLEHGADTRAGLPLFSTNGTPCEVYLRDNVAADRAGGPVRLTAGTYTSKDSAPTWPSGLQGIPASEVKEYVLANAGARPWDQDTGRENGEGSCRCDSGGGGSTGLIGLLALAAMGRRRRATAPARR